MHPRRGIRYAFAQALDSIAGVKIYKNRVHLIPERYLPAITVMSSDETSERQSMSMGSGGVLSRTLSIILEVRARDKEALDDVLDDFSGQIEDLISVDQTLGGVAQSADLVSTSFDYVEEQPEGMVQLTYDVMYSTN